MYTVACSTDETKRLTLCSNRLLLYVFASIQLVHRGLTMTQKDLTVQVCTLYFFFVLPRFDFKTFPGQPVAVLAINQSINQSINKSINQSINQSICQPTDGSTDQTSSI